MLVLKTTYCAVNWKIKKSVLLKCDSYFSFICVGHDDNVTAQIWPHNNIKTNNKKTTLRVRQSCKLPASLARTTLFEGKNESTYCTWREIITSKTGSVRNVKHKINFMFPFSKSQGIRKLHLQFCFPFLLIIILLSPEDQTTFHIQ